MKEPQITIDDNRVWMWLGHPYHRDSTKIDVTMAFTLGMAIASKEYDRIELADKYLIK